MRADWRAAKSRRTVSGSHARQLEIVEAQVIEPRASRMIRNEVLGHPQVQKESDERSTWRFAKVDRTDDESIRISNAVVAGHLTPADHPCRLCWPRRGKILYDRVGTKQLESCGVELGHTSGRLGDRNIAGREDRSDANNVLPKPS